MFLRFFVFFYYQRTAVRKYLPKFQRLSRGRRREGYALSIAPQDVDILYELMDNKYIHAAVEDIMEDRLSKVNRDLIEFWNSAYVISEEEMEECRKDPDSWKELVPSEKLFRAAESLGNRKRVLDYGCGMGWAGIVAAKSGCPDVTAVDVSETAVRSAEEFAKLYGVQDQIHTSPVSPEWLSAVSDSTYDGFFCSNVLDVVPSVTAKEIIREVARVVTDDARVVIGLNYYMSPEKAAERGIELVDGNCVYMNGVLRLVSHSDEEWTEIFSPYFTVEKLDHFAWPGETEETRRLFFLMKK